MSSLFDQPVPDLLNRLAGVTSAQNLERSLRSAYALEPSPWIGKALRAAAGQFSLESLPVLTRTDAEDGTSKLLVSLPDGKSVECVLIPDVRGTHSRHKMSARN